MLNIDLSETESGSTSTSCSEEESPDPSFASAAESMNGSLCAVSHSTPGETDEAHCRRPAAERPMYAGCGSCMLALEALQSASQAATCPELKRHEAHIITTSLKKDCMSLEEYLLKLDLTLVSKHMATSVLEGQSCTVGKHRVFCPLQKVWKPADPTEDSFQATAAS